MHIAICDDNIADRKHLERLLSRESDKRMGTPNLLYVDSYGDREHFLFHPLMYDMNRCYHYRNGVYSTYRTVFIQNRLYAAA